ncbi:MAG: hypothetical protein JWR40_2085 [Massilia sp.]|nr:hypothetical protein [Massilia sp.]MDB5952387.1 hypothetical protein [Massilia sp.]
MLINLYGTAITGAPHQAFWHRLTYQEFITGNVPGIQSEVQILQVGHGAGSNIVQALQGVGPLFGPGGNIGQMPADGSGPWTTAQIAPLMDWIDAGCPNLAATA